MLTKWCEAEKHKWVKVFKNGPSKICGRQPLKDFTWSILEYLDPNATLESISKDEIK